MKFTLSDAVLKLIPNSEFVIIGDSLDGLTFIKPKDAKKPSQSEIDQALLDLQNEYDEAKKIAENKLTALGLTKNDLKLLSG